jgi:hypothetical protein
MTWLAAVNRSATFVLSLWAWADREQAAIANPQKAAEIFFIIIVLPFASTI